MGSIERFEDIEASQKARRLVNDIHCLSNEGAFAKDFGLRDQIRRAGVSIMSNIAEGFERDGDGEFLQFLAIAKGSVGEVRAQLYVCHDQRYISEEMFTRLSSQAMEVSRMLNGLIQYLKRSGLKGRKYK